MLKHHQLFLLFVFGFLQVSGKSNVYIAGKHEVELYGRVRRSADDNVKTFLGRVAPFARISTGISLQSGLMNGSIPIDDVVGELFDFGPVKVSQVVSFKSDAVKAFIAKLSDVQVSFKSSQAILDAEDKVLKFEQVRKSSSGSTALDITSDMEQYFKDVGSIQNQLNFTLLEDIAKVFKTMSEKLESIGQISEQRTAGELIGDSSHFVIMNENFKKFEDLSNQINALDNKLRTSESLNAGSDKLKPFESMLESMASRAKSTISFDPLQTEIDSLLDLLSTSNPSKPAINLLKNLLISRTNPHLSNRRFTSGFADGYVEFDRLRANVLDSNLQKSLNSSSGLEKLNAGLKPLLAISYKLGGTNDKLGTLDSAILESVTRFESMQSQLSGVTVTKGISQKVLADYKSATDQVPSSVTSPVNTVIQNAKNLTLKVKELSEVTSYLLGSELKNGIEKFKSTVKFVNIQSNQVQEAVANLKKGKAREELLALVSKVNQKLSDGFVKELNETARSITKAPLETFKNTSVVKSELTFLENLGEDSGKVASSIRVIRMLREFSKNPKIVSDLETTLATVSTVSGDLKNLKLIVTEMKNLNSTESSALNKITSQSFDTIGNAVLGVYRIRDFLDQKESVDKLKLADDAVKTELVNLKDPALKSSIDSQWGSLKGLEDGLTKIKILIAKLNVSKANTPSQLGALFKSFESVGDVGFDGKSKRTALETLLPLANNSPVLKEGLVAVEKLESLDLHFSKYQKSFSGAQSAVEGLQTSLNSFLNPIPNSKMALNTATDSGSTEDAPISWYWYLIGAIVIVLVTIFSTWIICCCCCRRCAVGKFKKEKGSKDDVENNTGGNKNNNNDNNSGTKKIEDETPTPDEKEKPDEKKAEVEVKEESKSSSVPEAESKETEKAEDKNEKVKEEVKGKESVPKPTENKKGKNSKGSKKKSKSTKKTPKQEGKKTPTPKPPPPETIDDEMPRELLAERNITDAECINAANIMNNSGPEQYQQACAIQALHFDNAVSSGNIKSSVAYLIARKHRDHNNAPLKKATAVKVHGVNGTTDLKKAIQATEMPGRGPKMTVVAQAPLNASESHDDTAEDFLSMLTELESEKMVMIMTKEESSHPTFYSYVPETVENPITIGDYTIKLTAVDPGFQFEGQPEFSDHVTTKTLEIEDVNAKTSKTVTLYHIHSWRKDFTPDFGHDLIYKLWAVLSAGTEKPVVIHSMMGQDRAMVFAGIHLGAQYVEDSPSKHRFANICDWLRMHRPRSIGSVCLVLYLKAGIAYKLWMDHSEKDTPARVECMKKYGDMMGITRKLLREIPEKELKRRMDNPEHQRKLVYGNGL